MSKITCTPDGIAAAINRLARRPDADEARSLVPVMDEVFAEYAEVLGDRGRRSWARLATAHGAWLPSLAHEAMDAQDLRDAAVAAIEGTPSTEADYDDGMDGEDEYEYGGEDCPECGTALPEHGDYSGSMGDGGMGIRSRLGCSG